MFRDRWECGHIGTVIFAVQAVLLVPYIVIAVMGGGTTLRSVSGGLVPYWLGGAIVSLVVMGYVFFGGMRGTAWVNTFQTVLFLSFGAIAVVVIGAGMGGFRQAMESMLASPSTAPLLTRERVSPLYFFSYTFIPLSSIAFPHIGIFCLTARRLAHFRKTVVLYPICMLAIWLPSVFLGVVANRATDVPAIKAKLEARATLASQGPALSPTAATRLRCASAPGDDVILQLVEGYAPLWLAALLGAAVMAAVMASDSQILALSTMFTEDVFAFYGGASALRRGACRCRPAGSSSIAADRRRLRRSRSARRSRSSIIATPIRVRRLLGAVAAAGGGAVLEGQHEVGRAGDHAVDGGRGAGESRCCSRSSRRHRQASVSVSCPWPASTSSTRVASGTMVLGFASGGADDADFGAADDRGVVADADRPTPTGTLHRRRTAAREPIRYLTCRRDRRRPSDAAAVADRDHRRDRLRVRLLRAADAAADRAAGARRAAARAADQSRRSTTGSASSSTCRRSPAASSACSAATSPISRPPARARLEHPALRLLGVRRRLLDLGLAGCSSGAAARSSASASSSSPRSRGCRSCSRIPKQREAVVGYTQAFGSLGGIMVTGAYYLVVTYGRQPARGARRARGVALHADVRRHPGDSADPHPAVPAGVAGLAREESAPARSSGRASPSCSSRSSARTTIVTTVMMACGVRRGVRRDSADAAHRAGPAGSAHAAARRDRADGQRRAVVSGVRRAGRPHPARVSRGPHRQPAAGCCTSSRCPGLILVPLVFLSAATSSLTLLKWGIFLVGLHDDRAVQFLGELSAARLSDLPARHRRELRRQRRRPHDRHVGGAADDAAGERHAGRDAAGQAGLRGGARRHGASTSSASSRSFWLPEPKADELPD